MKKLWVVMLLLVVSLTSRAQVVEAVVLKPVNKGEEPQEVLDAIKRDFPEAVSRTLSVLPAKTYGQQWDVEVYKADDEAQPDYYEVRINAKNGYQTAVYDKTGKLIKVKQVIKNAELPPEVQNTVKKFVDWKVVGDEERITNDKKFTILYKVKLKKGLLSKTLFIDPQGNIKKELPV